VAAEEGCRAVEKIETEEMKHIILTAILLAPGIARAKEVAHKGDVTDIRVIRRIEQHPQAWRIWQPVIIQGDKKRHLLVAFGGHG